MPATSSAGSRRTQRLCERRFGALEAAGGHVRSIEPSSSSTFIHTSTRRPPSHIPLTGQQPRQQVVEQTQGHAPENVALDVDPVDVERLGEAERGEREPLASLGVGESTRRGREDPDDLRLLEAPGRVGGIRARKGWTRQPVRRVSKGGRATTTSTESGASPTSSSASRSAVARRSASSGSGLPPGSPSWPPWRPPSSARATSTIRSSPSASR